MPQPTFPPELLKAARTPPRELAPVRAPMSDILARLAQARAIAELPPLTTRH